MCVLQIDTLCSGVSGFLSVFRDGIELPVGFYSRQLKDNESRYSVSELKCLAVVDSVNIFRYLCMEEHSKSKLTTRL